MMKMTTKAPQRGTNHIDAEDYTIDSTNIHPVLLPKEEAVLMDDKTRIEYDSDGNAICFIDPWFGGEDGTVITEDNIPRSESLLQKALNNIAALYTKELIKYEPVEGAEGVCKFRCETYDDQPMTALIAPDIKKEIIARIGVSGIVAISIFGDIYTCESTRCYEEAKEVLNQDCGDVDGRYHLLKVVSGRYCTIVQI